METYKKVLLSTHILSMTEKKLLNQGISTPAALSLVEPIVGTNLIEIKTKNKDPRTTYLTANAWADSIVEFLIDLNTERYQVGKIFYSEQHRKNINRISELEGRLLEVRMQAQSETVKAEIDAKNRILLANISELEKVKSEIERLEAETPALSQIKTAQEENRNLQLLLKNDKGLRINQKLIDQAVSKPQRASNLAESLVNTSKLEGALSPHYATVKDRLEQNQFKLSSLVPTRKYLEHSCAELSEMVTRLQTRYDKDRVLMETLQDELELAHKQNALVFEKIGEAELAGAIRLADLRLISYSREPSSPLPPKTKKYGLWGSVIGTLLCLSLLLITTINGSKNSNPWETTQYARKQPSLVV